MKVLAVTRYLSRYATSTRVRKFSTAIKKTNNSEDALKNSFSDGNSKKEAVSKALKSILHEMELRRTQYIHASNADKKIDLTDSVLYPSRLSSADLIVSPAVGDLAITRTNDLCLIIEYTGRDSYTVCKLSGFLYEVPRFGISVNLGRVIEPRALVDCTRMVTIDGKTEKILIAQLAGPINTLFRNFNLKSEQFMAKVKDVLSNLISRVILDQKNTLNIPFFEMVRQVEKIVKSNKLEKRLSQNMLNILTGELPDSKSKNTKITVDPLYVFIVYTLLKNSFYKSVLFNNTADKSQLQTLTVIPTPWESKGLILSKEYFTQLLQMIDPKKTHVSNQTQDDFTQLARLYALEDIPKLDLEMRSDAILGLKEFKEISKDSVSTGSVLSLLSEMKLVNTSIGPFFDQIRFDFLKRHASGLVCEEFSFAPIDMHESVRSDFGDTAIYCIDAENSYEIDDGISIKYNKNKQMATVSVHIADPISSVQSFRDDIFLNAAYKTCSTAYFPVGVIPMLHTKFTSPFSLTANDGPKRCLTISFDFDFKTNMIVENSNSIGYHMIKNIHQLTYKKVDEILSCDKANPAYRDLSLLSQISNSLLQKRIGNGAVVDFTPKPSISVQLFKDKEPLMELQIPSREISPSQVLVSEIMITTNGLVARYTKDNNIPSLYRVQRPGNLDSLYSNNAGTKPSMETAVISEDAKPHHSLGLDKYSHSTSPLRRFQDLLVHWQLRCHFLEKGEDLFSEGELSIMSVTIQSLQQLIKEAQKKSLKYWVLKKLQSLILANKDLKLSCMVLRKPMSSEVQQGQQQVFCEELSIELPLKVDNKLIYPVGTKLNCTIKELNPACLQAVLVV